MNPQSASLLGLAAALASGQRFSSYTERRRFLGGKSTSGAGGKVNQSPGPEPYASQDDRAKTFDPRAADAPKKASRTMVASWGQPFGGAR